MTDEERAKKFIATVTWRPSKQYSKTAPHEYIVKANLPPHLKREYEFMFNHIEKHGYFEMFWRTLYRYINIGTHKYWCMTDKIEESNIMNRTSIENVYGSQNK